MLTDGFAFGAKAGETDEKNDSNSGLLRVLGRDLYTAFFPNKEEQVLWQINRFAELGFFTMVHTSPIPEDTSITSAIWAGFHSNLSIPSLSLTLERRNRATQIIELSTHPGLKGPLLHLKQMSTNYEATEIFNTT